MLSKILLPMLLVLVAFAITAVLMINRPEAGLESVIPVLLLLSSIIARREAVTHRVESQGKVSGQIQAVSPALV